MRCSEFRIFGLLAVLFYSACGPVHAAGTLDRDYGLGDDSFEGAAQGIVLGSGNAFGTTFDSMGTPLFGDLQDLDVFGGNGPVYADVSDRPLFGGGLGASFDGADDYLRGANLNQPDTSAASVNNSNDPVEPSIPGPLNYAGIDDRYFQFWAKPNSASQGSTQTVVMDSNQHGVRIVNGEWSMRYAGVDISTGVAVDFDQWTHVMLSRPDGPGGGSQFYVNGVAVAAAAGGYNGGATEELVVGSNTSRDGDRVFNGGTEEFYHGLLDNLTMAVLGDNTNLGGQNWGDFEFNVDNEFAANELSGFAAADVNMDGMVSGTGNGPAATDDVTAFVEGWLSENIVNGIPVGDLVSRGNADLDFNGVTNLLDWAILNAADPVLGSAAADRLSVPEPAAWALSVWLLFLLAAGRRFGIGG